MRKKLLREESMSFVAQAALWGRELTQMRSRGPGDTENAMRVLEREYGLDYWLLWRLRYRVRAIRDIGITAYVRLEAAYRAETQRQQRKLALQIERSKAAGIVSRLLDEAEGLAGVAAPNDSAADDLEE